jgi:hypothetical protein
MVVLDIPVQSSPSTHSSQFKITRPFAMQVITSQPTHTHTLTAPSLLPAQEPGLPSNLRNSPLSVAEKEFLSLVCLYSSRLIQNRVGRLLEVQMVLLLPPLQIKRLPNPVFSPQWEIKYACSAPLMIHGKRQDNTVSNNTGYPSPPTKLTQGTTFLVHLTRMHVYIYSIRPSLTLYVTQIANYNFLVVMRK